MGVLVRFTLVVAIELLHVTVQHSTTTFRSSKLLEAQVSVAYQWIEWSWLYQPDT